jgi:hypothetical protein
MRDRLRVLVTVTANAQIDGVRSTTVSFIWRPFGVVHLHLWPGTAWTTADGRNTYHVDGSV